MKYSPLTFTHVPCFFIQLVFQSSNIWKMSIESLNYPMLRCLNWRDWTDADRICNQVTLHTFHCCRRNSVPDTNSSQSNTDVTNENKKVSRSCRLWLNWKNEVCKIWSLLQLPTIFHRITLATCLCKLNVITHLHIYSATISTKV